jgi:hypothetical protein
LIVLDNLESVMQPYDRAGSFGPDYQDYGELLTKLGDISHQSCVVLTSREKPSGFAAREGAALPVRSLHLSGLAADSAQALLSLRGQFAGSTVDWQELVAHYAGNPLALKIAATAIADFFSNDVAQFLTFLQTNNCIFGDIQDLLASQFDRLTSLEQQILYELAISREPISLTDLQQNLLAPPSAMPLLEALGSLERRCFLEHAASQVGAGGQRVSLFTLQPVVMEYVTHQLIAAVSEQLVALAAAAPAAPASILRHHALMKAQAQDYIRESQQRLILQPIVDRLLQTLGREQVDRQLMSLVAAVKG